MSSTDKLGCTVALHLAWFLVLLFGWGWIAGQSGNPMPDNWPRLARIADVLGVALLAALCLAVLAPLAWLLALKGRGWATYPFLLLLHCGLTVTFGVAELKRPLPPEPVHAAGPCPTCRLYGNSAPSSIQAYHGPCWRFGRVIPAVDAVGKTIQPGDLLVIRSLPGVENPLPDTPAQVAQRQAWDGHIVIAAGSMPGGALRFEPTGADAAREAPTFCLWPDNVVHARTH